MTIKKIDHRTLDIHKDEHQKYISELFDIWIEEAELEMRHEGMHDIWQRNAFYNESYQVPIGATNDYLKEYIKYQTKAGRLDTRHFKVKKNKNDQIYVIDNKIPEVTGGLKAEFDSVKKVYQVKADDYPRNDRIEYAVRKYLEAYQDRKQIWDNIKKPCIDKFILYGLAWISLEYDPYVNLPLGDITQEVIHPKEVLVDPISRLDYFMDARYIIRKKKVELEEARTYFEQFGVDPKDVVQDNEYDYLVTYQKDSVSSQITHNQFCTIYTIEYRKTYIEEHEVPDDIAKAIMEKQDDKQTNGKRKNQKVKQKQMICFEAVYKKGLGCVDHKINEFADPDLYDQWQFKHIPLMDQPSEVRLYPVSKVEKLCNIQDIINILESVQLDMVREKNKLRGFMNAQLMAKYPQEYESWKKYGGYMPLDIETDGDLNKQMKLVDQPGFSSDTLQMLDVFNKTMKDQGPNADTMTGKNQRAMTRKEYMSGVAMQKEMAQRSKKMSPIAGRITWQSIQEVNIIYRIISNKFNSEDWADFLEKKMGDPEYFPINWTGTMEMFDRFLAKAYPTMKIPVDLLYKEDTPPEQKQQIIGLLEQAATQFEEHNDVETKYLLSHPETGRPFPPEVVRRLLSRVYVNFLKRPDGSAYKFQIKVKLDFDVEKDAMEDRQTAMWARGHGDLDQKTFLDMMGGGFAARKDEIMKNLEKENKMKQLMAEVEKRPGLDQKVAQDIQQYDQQEALQR